jgi:hypothetical protein
MDRALISLSPAFRSLPADDTDASALLFHFMIISTAGGSEKAIWFLLRRVAARGNVKAPG